MLQRRRILTGVIAAPFVITTPGLLMPVKKLKIFLPKPAPDEYHADLWNRGLIVDNTTPPLERLCNFILEDDYNRYNIIRYEEIRLINEEKSLIVMGKLANGNKLYSYRHSALLLPWEKVMDDV